jgi:hypothetical protein
MWFSEAGGNRIGRIDVSPAQPVDSTPPVVAIDTPVDGATFAVGDVVLADYACADEDAGSGLATCDGAVPDGSPIDTSLGTHTFAVTATDAAGNAASATTTYQVIPPPDVTAPTITIDAPVDGATLSVGDVVLADYACADEVGGSGLATCDGPVPSGSPIDTSLGTHTFTVTASDAAGNAASASASYAVLGDLRGRLDPAGTWNDARAGSAFLLSFELGPRSLRFAWRLNPRNLFIGGSPATQAVDCSDPAVALGPLQPADSGYMVTGDGRIHVLWKSDKRWTGTCRALTLDLDLGGWRDAPVTFLVRFR